MKRKFLLPIFFYATVTSQMTGCEGASLSDEMAPDAETSSQDGDEEEAGNHPADDSMTDDHQTRETIALAENCMRCHGPTWRGSALGPSVDLSKLTKQKVITMWTNNVGHEVPLNNAEASALVTTIKETIEAQISEDRILLGLIRLEPGSFTIGDAAGDLAQSGPAHQVTLSSHFFIADHEVTLSEFQAFDPTAISDNDCTDPTCPVAYVSWDKAQDYVSWLNRERRLAGGYQYRLCTEAEWEYAARAGGTDPWHCGSDSSCLDAVAWYAGNTSTVQLVKQKEPNSWGLHDMHGNLREWVQDSFSSYKAEEAADPLVQSAGENRVWRGGNYCLDAQGVRLDARGQLASGSTNHVMGLRVCASLDLPVTTDGSSKGTDVDRSAARLWSYCTGCHGANGEGGNGGPKITPSGTTPSKVASMWTNQAAGDPPLTSSETEALVAFIKVLVEM